VAERGVQAIIEVLLAEKRIGEGGLGMSRLASLLLGTILFSGVVVSMGAQTPSIKDIVLANEKKFSELQIQRKCDKAARFLDSNFRGISAGIATKSDGLGCQSGEVIPTRETFSHVDFALLSPDAARVTYEDNASFLVNGVPLTVQGYVASVWLKRGSEWLLSLHTTTSVPFVVSEQGKVRLLYSESTEHQDEAAGQRELETEIIGLEKRLWNGGSGEFVKLESDDYEAIKHAHRYHRADDEAAAEEASFSLVSMDDIRMRMLRPDVALLTYHATQKDSFRGIDVPPSLYFSSIWVNRGGEWKNVFLEENLPDAFTDTYLPRSGSKPERENSSKPDVPK